MWEILVCTSIGLALDLIREKRVQGWRFWNFQATLGSPQNLPCKWQNVLLLGQSFSDIRLRFLRNTFCLHILQIFADKCSDFREDSEYYTKHRELDSCPYTNRIVKGNKLVFADQLDGIVEGRNVYGILRVNLLECRDGERRMILKWSYQYHNLSF